MRSIQFIVIHCTATQPSTSIATIQRNWQVFKGWKSPGYHYIIECNGNIVQLQSEDLVANGVKGYNSTSIHISYIGGVDPDDVPKDTRTPEQLRSMKVLVQKLKSKYPNAKVQGHRDFPNVAKACPSFSVKEWLVTENIK